jgi:hypothetical protein
MLIVYVPVLPVPVPKAVIIVPVATPRPLTTLPTCRDPEEIAVTVKVLFSMEPVK